MAVKEDDRDRGISQGAEAFGPKQPTGEQAEFRISEVGVEANFRKQGLLGVYSAISIPSGNTVHLNMDPFLTQDDMTFPKHVRKVFFVREGVCQGDLASNSEGEVAGGNWGGVLDGTARPGTFNKANGRVGHSLFDGGTDTHDNLGG